MNKLIQNIILSVTKSSKILDIELIQTLWSGYGSLNRVTLNNKSVIIKLIKFPNNQDHPKGWNSNFSHLRKVKSYNVEMNWYKKYNEIIESSYSPRYIESGEVEDYKYLILEDLQMRDLTPRLSIEPYQVNLCLKWLANFHAKYINVRPDELWAVGTYWNLETRPDELSVMNDQSLKVEANAIDKKLNCAKFKTIVHGDAKLANFLFSDTKTAAVDFQYVGGGVGVKDVAYFLSSIYGEADLEKFESSCLDYYFEELKTSLTFLNNKIESTEIEKEWRELYPYVWCDFYRFLNGWSPDHSKINAYSIKMKEKVLNELK